MFSILTAAIRFHLRKISKMDGGTENMSLMITIGSSQNRQPSQSAQMTLDVAVLLIHAV